MVWNNEQWKYEGNSNAEEGQAVFYWLASKMNNTNVDTGEEREECAHTSTKNRIHRLSGT